MKVDGGLGLTPDIEAIVANAKAQEAAGYDGAFSFESKHDPFLPLAAACSTTSTLRLGTAVAIGVRPNPMVLANIGHDLQHERGAGSPSVSVPRSDPTSRSASARPGTPGRTHGRDDPGDRRHLGRMGAIDAPRLSGRLLTPTPS